QFADLEIELCKETCQKPDPDKLIFGHTFSDHMLEVKWDIDKGWSAPKICPFHDLTIHPASKVLHYASQLFEGSKAYRGYDNKVRLFRPDLNMERMKRTAERSALPTFDTNELVKCIKKLVEVDKDWVPASLKSSLYIRPTLIGTEPSLGVNKSNEALLYVITGPVGPYFPTGFKPVSLLADPQYVRAWEGGCGAFKMGANYAPTVMIQRDAVARGCQQVLWLHGSDHQITEVGTMNFLMYWVNKNGEEELVTPDLESGLILPGVTRQCILDLAREWNTVKVVERKLCMEELLEAIEEKRIKELFGAGTACVVCPIESILYKDQKIFVPTDTSDKALSIKFYNALHDIQYGKVEHPWTTLISET
ncbi:hypothetical protein HELRODRAFT_68641, partial [Helobdella robusta]|uniref:branched-chain-amino-acid transaminase n=1 Tax=Helobdella robusta TaxID=6412 RepID=T1FZH5_HELRO